MITNQRHSVGYFSTCLTILLATSAGTNCLAQDIEGEAAQELQDVNFLRVNEKKGDSITLEVAARNFEKEDGSGPRVCLVGVAHIGEKSLYDSIERVLGEYDLVLYESVKPAGAARPVGETDTDRITGTKASMQFIASNIALYRERINAYPNTTADLIIGLQTIDPRLAQWTDDALVDAWGNNLKYQRLEDGSSFEITSFGADGKEGGEGADSDLYIDVDDAVDPTSLSSEDGIQATLADMLGLEFQLTAVDYDHENWRCSDMTMDQLNRQLSEKGFELGALGGSFAGSGFSEVLAGTIIKLVKLLDVLTDGMMSDVAKIMMIELLGDETITDKVLRSQFGGGFAEVIVGNRNQVVMEDLKKIIKEEPEIESIAIFYGAAHMSDFVKRLDYQLGYKPADAEWITAMEVDIKNSALTEQDINDMRRYIRMMLKTMTP